MGILVFVHLKFATDVLLETLKRIVSRCFSRLSYQRVHGHWIRIAEPSFVIMKEVEEEAQRMKEATACCLLVQN